MKHGYVGPYTLEYFVDFQLTSYLEVNNTKKLISNMFS